MKISTSIDFNKIHIIRREIGVTSKSHKHLATAFLPEIAFDILYESDPESKDTELSHKFALTIDSNVYRAFRAMQKPGINIVTIEFSHKIDGYVSMSHEFLAEYDDCLIFFIAISEDEILNALMSLRYLFMVQVEDDIEELGYEDWWSKIHANYVECLKHVESINWISSLGNVKFGQNSK